MNDGVAQDPLARAERLLARVPLIDAHNDLPYVIRRATGGDLGAFALDDERAGRDTDIPRLRRGRVAGQFFAAFVPPDEARPASFALQQIALVRRMNVLHADTFLPATRAGDVARARKAGKIASFLAIENGAALEGRIETLETFHDLGVRLMTLCHNATTDWCDSATDAPRNGGLSAFGREVIAAMNRLGMVVDLAHVSDAVMDQVLDISAAPVVFSHSNARALCDHPRNVPDEILARVPSTGALVMATFVPDFISQRSRDWIKPLTDAWGKKRAGIDLEAILPEREKTVGRWPRGTLGEYCDHLDYLKARVGADHIGIGSDFFGGPQGEGLRDAACFPSIFAELMRRDWSEDDLERLAGGNLLRVMRGVEAAAD